MSSDLELYCKKHAFNQRILAQYQNKTTKLVWYEKFGKKYNLASGILTVGGDRQRFMCKMTFSVSGDEMLELCDRLGKASRMPGTFNDFNLADGSDWSGNPTRLVFRDSDYGGLVLVRLKSVKADVEVAEADDSDPDPDPMEESDDLPTIPNDGCAVWNECFEKFYFSRKDDWGNFKKILLSLHEDTQHMLTVDEESFIPPQTSVPPTVTQKQTVDPSQQSVSTKGGKRALGGKRKKPNNAELISEVFKKAVVILSCFMSHYRVSAERCVILYKKEMQETCLYNYESLVPLFDEECERLVYKIGRYNRPKKNSTQVSWDER
jgi:hypothetical protein